ncbi:MAG: PHP domain-containing protein [Patescibacteria group bacterium]
MSNEQIAKLLRNVAAAYIIKDERKFHFQIVAYQKAADSIVNSSIELADYHKDGELQNIPGIGVSIKGHLEELFATGKVKYFDWALAGIPESVFVLMNIPSFGPKKAYRLVEEFGLVNPKTVIADLKKFAVKGRIAPLKGFGEKSQKDILRAIREFKEGKGKTTRMVLPFASEIADKIIQYLNKCPDVRDARTLGSLRRMVPTVGDIDIAVASNSPRKVIKHFASYPYLERIIEKGDITASILVSGGRQVDLMVQPPNAFGSLLQHFTGSKNHNIALREFALKKGLSLSEYGIKNLKKENSKIRLYSSEKSFYKTLGLAWIAPEIRENTGEVELSAKNKLPKLIEVGDINGDFHLHSSFPIEPSHDLGKDSIKEMINKAISLNYSHIGFSEHNPSISKHTNEQIYNLIKSRNNEVDHILSGTKSIRVLKLLEVDILSNGELAIDDKSLSLLDFAIVSIHSVFSMNKANMTKRVIEGLSHPKAKVLAHPTGRLLNQRPGYELDWEKIFKFCKDNNKALEINAWPSRLDLSDQLIRQCVGNDVKMMINTDSHASYQMDNMKYGVAMARRGWATKSDILNTLDYNEFMKWLKGGEL